MTTTLDDEYAAVLRESAALRNELKILAGGNPRTVAAIEILKDRQRRLAQLKKRESQLRAQLAVRNQASKSTERRRQNRREELFIDLARQRFGEEAYCELWKEVDRLERLQWQELWSSP